MLKKLNFNSQTLVLKSPIVFAIGLFLIMVNAHASIQEKLDKKYTTSREDSKVFMQMRNGLSNEEIDTFMLGKSFYTTPWVEAPSATTARDGLGPLFSANTCIHCHPNNSRANIYDKNSISRAYITRLSIPSNGSKKHEKMLQYNGFIQEPTYGNQISINGVFGVPFEAKPKIVYEKIILKYPDNSTAILHKPLHGIDNQLQELNYGDMDKNVAITNRLAPALVGLGLLEEISDEQILKNQDINDANNDGISGKANIVYSPLHKDFRVGRFTYKASIASVYHQSAAAANNDMSLTTEIFPSENCTSTQTACLNAPKADARRGASEFDLPQKRVQAIAFYLKNLKIPKSKITQKEGEKLFESIGCVNCHKPSFTLKNSYKIKPYSDLLLHDMGEGLSDGRGEFLASAREWRTAPLWGIGKYKLASKKEPELLHDGRAKSIEEAILWHGGEAEKTKNSFMNLSLKQRENLIDFIKEL